MDHIIVPFFFTLRFVHAVWDVHFHPTYPNSLFSCAQDGSLWHWDASLSSSSASVAATSSLSQHLSSNPRQLASYSSHAPSNALLSHAAGSSQSPLLATGLLTNQRPTTADGSSLNGHLSTTTTGRTAVEETPGESSFVGTSPWLSGAIQQGKVEIVNLLPDNRLSVNSLDIESRHLICGTDGEALFIIPDLNLT